MEETVATKESIKMMLDKICTTRSRYYDIYVKYLEKMHFAIQNRSNVPVYVATKYYEDSKTHYNMVVYLDVMKSHVYAVFSTNKERGRLS